MMETEISRIVNACFLKSAHDVREYLKNHFGIYVAFENDNLLHDEYLMRIINSVDERYLDYHGIEEISGLPSPIIRLFSDVDKEMIYYDPCSRFYSRQICYPCHAKKEVEPEFLREFLEEIASIDPKSFNSDECYLILSGIFEDYGSLMSVNGGINSLFELTKLRAGLATAIYCVSRERGDHADEGVVSDPVLSCSFDFLGIKDFKFLKENSTDLKRETAASLFIDLLRENVLDEFLSELGISRCNLIFSGGRHLHMFLPNTESVRKSIETFILKLNDWLVRLVGETLFVSYGTCALSSLELGKIRDEDYYLNIFIKIANHKALMESHRYSAAQIQCMNRGDYIKGPNLDIIVNSFDNDKYYVVTDKKKENSIEIIEGRFIYASDTADVTDSVRVYESNQSVRKLRAPTIRIWHQRLCKSDIDISKGNFWLIRLDIDGFNTHMLGNPGGYIHPNEKMELSKHLAFFMKRDVSILADMMSDKEKVIFTIHEGADDLFILMSEEIMNEFVKKLVLHYKKFTGGCLSFCAGISKYNHEKGFAYSCGMAQHLMDRAKKNPGKDSVVISADSAMMKWKDYFENVDNTEASF